MFTPPVVEGEGSGQPSKPQPAPSTAQPRIEEQILFPQPSVPIPNVADEAVFKEWDDRVNHVPRSHGGVIAQTWSERSSKHSYDSPLPGGNTPGSDEERIEQDDLTDFVPPTPYDSPLPGGHTPGSDKGRPNINELVAICKNMSNRVLALEQSKTAQDLVIKKLKKKVRKLEKKLRARTPRMKLFKISTSKRKSLDEDDFVELGVDNAMENVEGDAETRGRNTAEQITTNEDTVNTASIEVSVAGPSNVSTADPSTSIARDIFEDEMMTIVDTLMAIRSTRPRITLVVIRDVEEEPRRASPVPIVQSQDKEFDNVQARMEADALLAARLQEKERERFFIDEQARFLVETIAERKRKKAASIKKRPRAEPNEESVKRQKIGETLGLGEEQSAEKEKELSEEELQKLLVIFADMLKKFNIDDLVKLWDLVKKRFSITKPTDDKEKEL
ncbi:hypothetical protein Tco_1342637 [Tanacetum coccineum]